MADDGSGETVLRARGRGLVGVCEPALSSALVPQPWATACAGREPGWGEGDADEPATAHPFAHWLPQQQALQARFAQQLHAQSCPQLGPTMR